MTAPENPEMTTKLWERLRAIHEYMANKRFPSLIGIRGFEFDGNKRDIYDDVIFIILPKTILPYLANVDPSYTAQGIASLEPGMWHYKKGKHGYHSGHPYDALVQASPVTVKRDGIFERPETGMFAINIHKGGLTTTGSLGCQTVHPMHWDSFITTVYEEMDRFGVNEVPYILVNDNG